MKSRVAVAVVVFSALVLSAVPRAQAGTIRHDVSNSTYTALAGGYPSVGYMTWPGRAASGVLIAPDWVLTAAHVLDDPVAAASYTFDFTPGAPGGDYTGLNKFVHPGWTGTLGEGFDLALLQLSTSVLGISPALLSDRTDELGRLATIVGFGLGGTGLTGATGSPGTKRAGFNVVDLLGSNIGFSAAEIVVDFDNPDDASTNFSGSPIPHATELLPAPGDSGGGWFIDFGDGVDLLAGIESWGLDADGSLISNYGDAAGATRVSSQLQWIFDTSGVPPFSPTAVPLPSAAFMGLGLLGAFGAFRRFRRRR